MIYAFICAGLGNQLFQYAAGRSLASRHNVPLVLDASWFRGRQRDRKFDDHRRTFDLPKFRLNARVATTDQEAQFVRQRKGAMRQYDRPYNLFVRGYDYAFNTAGSWLGLKRVFHEAHFHYDRRFETLRDETYIIGNFQSEKYFLDIRPELEHDLIPADETIVQSAAAIIARARGDGSPLVSIHVRRGDNTVPGHDQNHPVPRVEYFDQAMGMFPATARFLVFSDDMTWCRANLARPRLSFADGRDAIADFAAMALCDHHIISASTFSWWAAWLHDADRHKKVVYPSTWVGPNFSHLDLADLFPRHWIKL